LRRWKSLAIAHSLLCLLWTVVLDDPRPGRILVLAAPPTITISSVRPQLRCLVRSTTSLGTGAAASVGNGGSLVVGGGTTAALVTGGGVTGGGGGGTVRVVVTGGGVVLTGGGAGGLGSATRRTGFGTGFGVAAGGGTVVGRTVVGGGGGGVVGGGGGGAGGFVVVGRGAGSGGQDTPELNSNTGHAGMTVPAAAVLATSTGNAATRAAIVTAPAATVACR
jgi:hypothetical protein